MRERPRRDRSSQLAPRSWEGTGTVQTDCTNDAAAVNSAAGYPTPGELARAAARHPWSAEIQARKASETPWNYRSQYGNSWRTPWYPAEDPGGLGRATRGKPERALVAAIVLCAIEDALCLEEYDPRRAAARQWFLAFHDRLGSFVWALHHLNFDVEAARGRMIAAFLDPAVAAAMRKRLPSSVHEGTAPWAIEHAHGGPSAARRTLRRCEATEDSCRTVHALLREVWPQGRGSYAAFDRRARWIAQERDHIGDGAVPS